MTHLLAGTLIALFVLIAVIDIRHRRIPNILVLIGVLLLLPFIYFAQTSAATTSSIIPGAGLGAVLTLPGWLLNKLGGGDVKLSMLLGAFLGPMGFLWSVVLAVPFGFIFFLYHRLSGRAVPTDLPVGAFLAGGASIVLITAAWPFLL